MNSYKIQIRSWKFVKSKRFDKKVWDKYDLYSLRIIGVDLEDEDDEKGYSLLYTKPFKISWVDELGRYDLFGGNFTVDLTKDASSNYISLGRGLYIKPTFSIYDILEIKAKKLVNSNGVRFTNVKIVNIH